MRYAYRPAVLLALAMSLGFYLVSRAAPMRTGDAPDPQYVAGADTLHPRLRFGDALVSQNDRCIVTGRKLNPRMAPMYVNGAPIGFC
jgi:hypothetical protein